MQIANFGDRGGFSAEENRRERQENQESARICHEGKKHRSAHRRIASERLEKHRNRHTHDSAKQNIEHHREEHHEPELHALSRVGVEQPYVPIVGDVATVLDDLIPEIQRTQAIQGKRME